MSTAASLVEVRVPDMGNFKDVAVIDVLVKPGDTIAIDTPLVTLESDKATMDVPSTAVGVVEKVHTSKGGKVNTGDLIATVRADGALRRSRRSRPSPRPHPTHPLRRRRRAHPRQPRRHRSRQPRQHRSRRPRLRRLLHGGRY